MVQLDPNNAFHTRVAERLKNEHVGWIVTVSADGTPQPSPVWFLWDGGDKLLIYSQHTPKTRHIQAHPQIAFHLNSDANGGDVITFTGTAAIDTAHPKALDDSAYRAKYDDGIKSIGMTTEQFSAGYDTPVIVTLEKLRGH